jgi:uncharacterized protein YceH (UPF0502 family)
LGYDGDKNELRALENLEEILGVVADELATWRTRALKAEQELQTLVSGAAGAAGLSPGAVSERLADLEVENRDLRARVDRAKERVAELVRRLGFLEQQTLQGSGGRS